MLSRKAAKFFIIGGAAIIILMIVFSQVSWYQNWAKSSGIANGVSIGGYDVSGYDMDSARQMLEIQLKNKLVGQTVTISHEDISNTLNASSFSHMYYELAIQKAISFARAKSPFENYKELLNAKLFGLDITPDIQFDDEILTSELQAISHDYFIQANDAQIVSFDPSAEEGKKLSVMAETTGRELDIKKTADDIKEAVLYGDNQSKAYLRETHAAITEELLHGMEASPITSEYTISPLIYEYESALVQVVDTGIYQVLMPGQEISVIEFMQAEDYIFFVMSDDGEVSEYDRVLTEIYPTQIYLACILSELEVPERQMREMYAKNLPAGTACIANQYYDMKVKNPLDVPVIIRIAYSKKGAAGQAFCEIYRPQMEYRTLVRSVRKPENGKTLVDITRVYVDNKGNTVDTFVVETVENDG